jgi:hypothetical protein
MIQENGECMKPVVRMPGYLLTIIAISFVARALAQTYVIQSNVTDSSGSVIATATTQFTLSAAATNSTNAGGGGSSTAQPSGGGSTGGGSSGLPTATVGTALPVMVGQTYASDAWLATFLREKITGNIDLTPLLVGRKIHYLSTAATPGHLATDFADWASAQKAAIADGDPCFGWRDGGQYGPSFLNTNVQNLNGTALRPVIITRIGRNGFNDHSLPLPFLSGGRLCIAGSPVHYVIYDGLRFTGGLTVAGSALGFDDFNTSPSDYLLYSDCHIDGCQEGFSFQSIHPTLTHEDSTYILDGCTVSNCVGGADGPGMYIFYIRDLLLNRCYFVGNGGKNQLGTAHGVYLNSMYQDATDLQVRFINTVFAASAAAGCECNRGGFFHNCLSLSNPIAFYGGGGAAAEISHCVVDGGGGEFDMLEVPITSGTLVKFASAGTFPPAPGNALNLQPGTGANRGWGCYLDAATTGSIHDTYIINKPEHFNAGFAVGVHTVDGGKAGLGMPSAATIATLGPNLIVHNWYEWSADGKGSPNFVNLAGAYNGKPAPTATINFNGLVVLSGVTGVAGVTAIEPKYVDDTRTCSSFAKTLGIAGVTDGPTLAQRMEAQDSTNWDPRLEAQPVFNYIQAGFQMNQ